MVNVKAKSSRICILVTMTLCLLALLPTAVQAADAREIDVSVDVALERFQKEVNEADVFLSMAKGYLVFPNVVKAGLAVGGEYGEGALRIGGKSVAYYSTAAASIGFQVGVQKKSIVVIFLTEESLAKFRKSKGWEVGVDGSVAFLEEGAGGSFNTSNIKDPIVGFVFGQKGLMYNLTLEGTKFTKLNK